MMGVRRCIASATGLALLGACAACGGEGNRTNGGARPGTVADDAVASVVVTKGGARCVIEHLANEPLVLSGGREAYVEPQTLAATGSGILLAGVPSYLWRRKDAATLRAVPRAANPLVAALVDSSGARTAEPPPALRHVEHVRAAVLPDGRWGAVMSVVAADSITPFAQAVQAIRYAEHDGRAWSTLEALPLPPAGVVHPFESTDLVVVGDRLVWFVPWSTEDSGRRPLLEYERRGGTWTRRPVGDEWVEAASAAYTPTRGLWLAKAGPDPDSTFAGHSLRLYRRAADGWRMVHRIAELGPDEHAREPRLVIGARGLSLSWRHQGASGWAAMAARGITADASVEPASLDPDVMQVVPLVLEGGTFAWILSRALPSVLSSELRVILDTPAGPRTALALPNPFTGYFAAAVHGRRITIAGPEFDPNPAEPTVRSLFIHLGASCL